MKRFEFRLERVLKLKQQRERVAEQRLMQARMVHDAAQAAVAALQVRLHQASLALAAKVGQAVDAAFWTAHYLNSAQITTALEAAEANEREAARKLHEAGALRTQIATEVEALVSLRRQQWQVHRREVLQVHQQQMDEVGLRRWTEAQAGDLEQA